MKQHSYDVIVLGTGGVGSAALFYAAEAGHRVLGLDRFPPGHDKGSSHGETRMIRQSYFEHPDYVPLLRHAYRLWDNLCEQTGLDLFRRTGILYYGQPDGPLIKGVTDSADVHDISLEHLSSSEARPRFPGFTADDDYAALFERNAGYLLVEECIKTYIAEAITRRAKHRYGETVIDWQQQGDSIVVSTDRNRYHCDKLIITAGCWTRDLLNELGIPLRLLRKHLYWFDAPIDIYGESSGCPGFAYEVGEECFYGFPMASQGGLKVARHTGGTEIEDPLEDSREQEQEDTNLVLSFLRTHLPAVTSNQLRHEVCFYTNSPDENYIVDFHPGNRNVAFVAGLSGHGFKSAAALGDSMVRMIDGRNLIADIAFLNAGRFHP